ncbi:hypothetical protein ACFSJM_08780 [Lactococcus formosensis subsp. bovis]|uniref:hypothetical protein n=1 Tax=Lactococcus formosensis TaxID=1281486 RepID=UPI001BCDF576|nr:hypothetical protein [Lactococcus formosensis]
MGFNYFNMAETALKNVDLSMDDLGEYSSRIHEFVLSAAELINPKTGEHYSEKERQVIRLARQYFRDGRVSGGWDEEYERKKIINDKQLEQEKKFAALGYTAQEISEKLGVSKSKIYKDGFKNWPKHGELRDEN